MRTTKKQKPQVGKLYRRIMNGDIAFVTKETKSITYYYFLDTPEDRMHTLSEDFSNRYDEIGGEDGLSSR